MAEADVEYERSVGSGEQLPQGAAASLNAQAQAVPPPEPAPMPELAQGEPADYRPADEEDEILFGDATGAGRQMPAGPGRLGRVPPEVVRKLPALARAASSPDAPPSLVALYRLTLRELEDEMRDSG